MGEYMTYLFLAGELEDENVRELCCALLSTQDQVTLFITSCGGPAYLGRALIDAIELREADTTTVALGMVASSALAVFVAGDRRMVGRHGWFVFHGCGMEDISGGIRIVQDTANEIDEQNRWLCHFMSERTKWDYAQWMEQARSGDDLRLYPADALQIGLVDEFAVLEPESEEPTCLE
jgi:ATP-dependent protease ClpP protease subunit